MSNIPRHIGIIMDGNGRWAGERRRPRTFGHIKGARVAKKIISHCARIGVKHLTLFAFSTENWLRPASEVSFLMQLLRRQLTKETANLVKENVRFETIGDLTKLPNDLIAAVQETKRQTAQNTGLKLTFALNYGGRAEIVQAVKAIVKRVQDDELQVESIDEATVHAHLETYPNPDPDLIIRTSGEARISNFLLWQSAYSEFYFTNVYWPDFKESDFDLALAEFARRNRRFGLVSDDAQPTL